MRAPCVHSPMPPYPALRPYKQRFAACLQAAELWLDAY
jgi:hypothetical protein